MFGIGFTELLVIGVVALLIFGPEDFLVMARKGVETVRTLRNFANQVRADLKHEVHKVEEIKQLMEREVEIAKEHAAIDPEKLSIPSHITVPPAIAKTNDDNAAAAPTVQETSTHSAGPDHGRNT